MKGSAKSSSSSESGPFVLVIHGGAGTMSRASSTPAKEQAYHTALRAALQAGSDVLKSGGDAMDSAVAAVSSMEDNILFNSGRGAVFTTEGKNEMEVSLMLSKPPSSAPLIPASRRGMSLTLLSHIANPSQLARALYLRPDRTSHSFLSAPYAETLAHEELGFELKDPSYFFSQKRWEEHRNGLGLPLESLHEALADDELSTNPQGTVGAVALDVHGCICAVTSTGGRTNKLPGRIGDTPHMGAGFWAEAWLAKEKEKTFWDWLTGASTGRRVERSVGISGTGNGDYFIRQATALNMTHHLKSTGCSVQEAAERAAASLKSEEEYGYGSPDADGGIIALDGAGNVAMALNCEGMYRGYVKSDGVIKTGIFKDDQLDVSRIQESDHFEKES